MEIFKIEIQLLESFLMPRKLTQGPTEEGAERDVHGLPLMPRFLSLLPLPVQAGVNFLRQALPFVEWVFFAVFGRGIEIFPFLPNSGTPLRIGFVRRKIRFDKLKVTCAKAVAIRAREN